MHRKSSSLDTRANLVVHNMEAVIDNAVKVLGEGVVAHAGRSKCVARHLEIRVQGSEDACKPLALVQCKDVLLTDGAASLSLHGWVWITPAGPGYAWPQCPSDRRRPAWRVRRPDYGLYRDKNVSVLEIPYELPSQQTQ